MSILAAHTDARLRELAGHKGEKNKDAWAELIRRGIEHDPQAGKARVYTGKKYADYEIRRRFER